MGLAVVRYYGYDDIKKSLMEAVTFSDRKSSISQAGFLGRMTRKEGYDTHVWHHPSMQVEFQTLCLWLKDMSISRTSLGEIK